MKAVVYSLTMDNVLILLLRIYIRYFRDTENYIAVKNYETYIFPVLNIALKGEKACDAKKVFMQLE